MSNWMSQKEAENMTQHVPMYLLKKGYEIVQLEGKEGYYLKIDNKYYTKGIGYKYALGEGVVTGITFSVFLTMALLYFNSFQEGMNFLNSSNADTILSGVQPFHLVFIFLVFTLLGFVASIFTPNKMHEIKPFIPTKSHKIILQKD